MYRIGVAYLLWALSGFGWFGLHRFYLGKIPTGILWLCTGGLFGFGSLYDFFTLPLQMREANLAAASGFTPAGPAPRGNQPWRSVDDMEVRNVREDAPEDEGD